MPPADSEISHQHFLDIINQSDYLTQADINEIRQAIEFGQKYHNGHRRASGLDYFKGHCMHVGLHLYILNMSKKVIIAGLLHDIIEDTEADYDVVEAKFGTEVADLIDGLTKLSPLKYQNYKRHIPSLRKFFVAVAKDVRVIIIKLCDRLHNLQTLHYLPAEKQKRIAEESMLIHAPLAQRLNIAQLYQQINDAAFPYALPQEHKKTQAIQKQSVKKAQKTIENIYRKCLVLTSQTLNYTPSIDKRIKTTYSLYKKLVNRDWNIEVVYDIIALRIILENEADCYTVLGLIHNQWQPLPNRFKDYIATPKPNGYQSIHTTIFSGDGSVVEIQIKTTQMHRYAEFGAALHMDYKSKTTKDPLNINRKKVTFHWLDQLKEVQDQSNLNFGAYAKELQSDFFTDRIFVLTPRGDVVDLAQGATILDFAFAIHTDLGIHAKAGRINGVYKALKTPLKEQDIVEIILDKRNRPKKEWLNWVKTSLAKQKIRQYLKKQNPH